MTEAGFWAKVDKSGECWLWMGCITRDGYGQFRLGSRRVVAHRFSWEQTHGPIPDGLFACHRCDVRACVRPDHLFLGTPLDNIRDMDAKGRRINAQVRGLALPQTRYTEDQVRELRAMHAAGATYKAMVERFGGSEGGVWNIIARKNWKWVH